MATKAKISKKVNRKEIPKKDNKVSVPKKKITFKFDKKKALKVTLTALAFLTAFTLVDLLFQYLNNDYSMAVVNGERIPKGEFYNRLEKAYGSQASVSLIEETLITQEALKDNIKVSDKNIEERLDDIENQIGGKDALNSALKANNITMDDLKRQVKLEIYAKKILSPDIKYNDEDLKEFFDQYKDVLYTETDVKFEDKKAEIEETYIGQKVEEKKQEWLTKVKADSKIQNNITDQPKYAILKTTVNIFRNIWDEFKK